MDSGGPQAQDTPKTLSAGRKAWLILRVYLSLMLGVGISVVSYTAHSVIGCLLGCLVILAAVALTCSRGSGITHRYGSRES